MRNRRKKTSGTIRVSPASIRLSRQGSSARGDPLDPKLRRLAEALGRLMAATDEQDRKSGD
jgi:hypothetical protein